ncbi:hypothetical protein [Caproicibacter fermentans]|uniref:VPS9 domain-containing protein n=1 Tax=Caproicibacter fermentans TaxID=2576756 RepID=A0A7G8T8A6_9FIRM|nr:hypothetical protein [Caproicibacter fermentans]QNK39847.1 hypothetical protein HCR03_14145 [Caproicibacter fermentans]
MSVIDKAKDRLQQLKNEQAERARLKKEEKAERERQQLIKQKEETQALLEQLKIAANELGLSFSEYMAFLNYRSLDTRLTEIQDNIDYILSRLSSFDNNNSDVGEIRAKLSDLESKIDFMSTQP